MRKVIFVLFILFLTTAGIISYFSSPKDSIQGAPAISTSEESVPSGVLSWLSDWSRPDLPAKVAIQVGHFKNDDLPEELKKLRTSDGASAGGYDEWEVNLTIAREIENLLKADGIFVELLPATVPEKYWSDVFIAIHADGSEDTEKSGYKITGPWRDLTGNAESLISSIDKYYKTDTGLSLDPNITRNMRGYYAFSWWRYDHAIHPMTTAVIIETGFLTNSSDRAFLTNHPEISAKAIYKGVVEYLQNEKLI
ncbi:N-acetylmuramoyl-L-alanine amidase [Candidatus Woesebacteria bacterium]|nr:N-acetylmuramoyl-L-alanine amidase [Candidatus Woesebacteria bacterium]